jgi:hypothetical protein
MEKGQDWSASVYIDSLLNMKFVYIPTFVTYSRGENDKWKFTNLIREVQNSAHALLYVFMR